VGVGCPDVKGTSEALEPEKAGAPLEAEGLGRAVVELGFKILISLLV